MGDIADDMINGDFDYITGEYLGEGGGFPRTRDNSFRQEEEKRRMDYCAKKITDFGIHIDLQTKKEIRFQFKGETVKMYPYTGWHTGKSITDGRGIENLLKQLKNG